MILRSDPRGSILRRRADAFVDMEAWHRTAAELRRDAPILRVDREGWLSFWALTKHADVAEVSRRSDVFLNTGLSAPGPRRRLALLQAAGLSPPRSLVHLHGARHEAHRALVAEWFRPTAVRARAPEILRIASEAVARLDDLDGRCDLARDVIRPFTLRVLLSVFGAPKIDERLLGELTDALFGAGDDGAGAIDRGGEPTQHAIQAFRRTFDELVADRRANPRSDLATVIALGEGHDGSIGEEERFWLYVNIATAGHDTASYALAGGILELLRHPDQLGLMLASPPVSLEAASAEMIRWASPVRCFFRFASEDTSIGGVAIGRGDAVLTSYPSANRDEAVFERATEFDVRRSDAAKHLGFGLGVHHCLGAAVARLEVRALLEALFSRLATIELTGEPAWSRSHFVSGVKGLPVRYTLRRATS